jgi:hypothetical protein
MPYAIPEMPQIGCVVNLAFLTERGPVRTKIALGFQEPYWTLPPGDLTLPPVAASVMSRIVVINAKITTAVERTFFVANRAARGAIKIAPDND